MFIYKITNKLNEKFYIGQTVQEDPSKRWQAHLTCAKNNPQLRIQHAIRKYGEENFLFEVIDTAETVEELNQKEIYWIERLHAIDKGYNIKPGGDCNPMNVPEVKARHDSVMRSTPVRNKISNTMKELRRDGFSEEHRIALKEGAKRRRSTTGNNISTNGYVGGVTGLKALNTPQGDVVYVLPEEVSQKLSEGFSLRGGVYSKCVSCMMEDGTKYSFPSVKEAAEWWQHNGREENKLNSLMGAIKKSATECRPIHGVKWYYKGGDMNEIDKD